MKRRFLAGSIPPLLVFSFVLAASQISAQPFDPSLFSGMRWRLVGPFRGGRAVTATGVPGQPDRFYFGAVGGGVWRTDNAGRTWEPIFDSQPIASIGAIAVAPSNPNVLYVGSGEADMRSDISYGNGVYKSADGGKTWAHVGLEGTRQIGQILVDPRDPNLVFVAALGHAYGPNRERGVFRSKDGGRSWTKVLFKDENTGAVDLAFQPGNSRTILAALWQTRRPPWNTYPPSNGPGGGLYRSEDGGDTWQHVTNGMPSGELGRIRVAFAPSEPRRVYAIVDAKKGGLYVSEDGGLSFKLTNPDHRIWGRGWYFAGVTVDPKNASVVYACNVTLYRSTDGGRSFLPFKGAPGGDDYHRLWIDPADPGRMITASDQGTVVTVDGGRTWSSWYNQPTAQFYHVATDDRFPYWIYGAQQDTGAAATLSRSDYRSIMQRDWKPIAAGGENGYIAPDPKDANLLWGGTVGRFDLRTFQNQNVDPTLGVPGDYRGEWTLPLAISPRDPKAVYFGNQFLWKTVDGGRHWSRVSPDLTRESPAIPAGLDPPTVADSPVTGQRRGVIWSVALSPLADGKIWCGTNDGLIWLSRDDGVHWSDVTPRQLTPWSAVGILEPSHFDAATAYAAVDRHRLDDLAPYVYRTRDDGRSWELLAKGIPGGSYVNVVREDPVRRGLLYAGTETGVFVSFDDGDSWQPLKLNLPNCSIRDIDVSHGDLVVATHGRSFWVLDDLSPLRQLDERVAAAEAFLFAPREAVRLHPAPFLGTPEPKDEPMGENPKRGASIDYYLKAAPPGALLLEVLDAKGALVHRVSSEETSKTPDLSKIVVTPDWVPASEPLSAAAGMHRFVWDLHYPVPKELAGPAGSTRRPSGIWAPPGRYAVRLTAFGKTFTQPLVVVRDPRLESVTDADLIRQYDLAREIQAERVRVAVALRQANALRTRMNDLRKGTAAASVVSAMEAFSRALDELAGPPVSEPGEESWDMDEIPLMTLRGLSASLAGLAYAVESADAAPTRDALAGLAERKKLVEIGLSRWRDFLASDLPKANRTLEAEGLARLTAE
ncbi:MAG: WD40/YVTN/BNR-like repeat-containing protein [Acidithiobacillales bacterium]